MNSTHTANQTLTIAILSSQCLIRLGLKNILESSTIIQVVVLPHQKKLPDLLCADSRPDLFILDADAERHAVGILTQIRESAPTSKIVLLCGFGDKERTCEALAAGVDGIILKVQPPEVVLAVIESLYGSTKFPAGMGENHGDGLNNGLLSKKNAGSDRPPPAWPEALTEREREIICLVEQGFSNKDIAYKLSISDSTVRHHMTNIFDKVGVPNRQKLLVHAQYVRSAPA
ncbi:MAG TPA: response regulator transcription factor [Nitrospira sp.]|nr:response regulator transcription factor [Nitrospira sp.]